MALPMKFSAAWTLDSRPRRMALLMDDVQEEYRPFARQILPNLVALKNAFQARGCPVVWSSWSRQYDDGISNAHDRWYGVQGLTHAEGPTNALYVFEGSAGLEPLREIAPTPEERREWFYHSKHLDMFWSFRADGKSWLDEKLKDYGVDTVVITGLWTDECIISTAYAALSRGYDVIVISDAVATATAHHQIALTIMNATAGKVLPAHVVLDYVNDDNRFSQCAAGEYKGVKHPDGRKD